MVGDNSGELNLYTPNGLPKSYQRQKRCNSATGLNNNHTAD